MLHGTYLLFRAHIPLYRAYISLYRAHIFLYRAHIFLHTAYLPLYREHIFLMYNKHSIIYSMHTVLYIYIYIYIYIVPIQSVNNCYVGNTYGYIQHKYWICGNKMPTRYKRGFYCKSYCLLNMFRAPLCPSSGAQEYYTAVAACDISCCGIFQVAGLVWS